MPFYNRAALATVLFAVGAMPALAQTTQANPTAVTGTTAATATATPAATASSPSNATGQVIGYQSAFEGYRRLTDEPVVSWKGANDNVGRIGGWRVYAREAAGQDGGHAGHPAAATAQPMTGGASAAPATPRSEAAPPAKDATPAADHKNHH